MKWLRCREGDQDRWGLLEGETVAFVEGSPFEHYERSDRRAAVSSMSPASADTGSTSQASSFISARTMCAGRLSETTTTAVAGRSTASNSKAWSHPGMPCSIRIKPPPWRSTMSCTASADRSCTSAQAGFSASSRDGLASAAIDATVRRLAGAAVGGFS